MVFILPDSLIKIIFGYAYPDLEDIINATTKMDDLNLIYKFMNITYEEIVYMIGLSCKVGNESLALSLYDQAHIPITDVIIRYLGPACEYGCLNFVIKICEGGLNLVLENNILIVIECISFACSNEHFEVMDYLIKKFNIVRRNLSKLKEIIHHIARTCKRSTAVKIFDRYKKYIDESAITDERSIEFITL